MANIPASRIIIARRDLARLHAERADRASRGANIPTWFDRLIETRQVQLNAMIEHDEHVDGHDAPIPTRYWAMVGLLIVVVFLAWVVQ